MYNLIKGKKPEGLRIYRDRVEIHFEGETLLTVSLEREDYDDYQVTAEVETMETRIKSDELLNLEKGDSVFNDETGETGIVEGFGDGYDVLVTAPMGVRSMNACVLSVST